MSYFNKLISNLFRQIADDLDTGNSNVDAEGCHKIMTMLDIIENGDEPMSKVEATEFLGVSRATFDNLVRDGFIPKGEKKFDGVKSLFWNKSDLVIYKENNKTSCL